MIYGAQKDPSLISVEARLLNKLLHQGGFYSTLFDVKVNGKAERALARDVQFDPVTDFPVHVDFLRVSAATSVHVEVPVHFVNEDNCPGIDQGGVLNVVRHEVELVCRADAIPAHIEVDLTGLDIGDGVHISMVKLPDGVKPAITDRDFTIATIAAPTVVRDEAAAAQAPAEGEGEGEEKAEESKED
ncbi:MAG: 50S ribosomal protein L25/general stress protein Ctc [Kiloniellaceae bacterium]